MWEAPAVHTGSSNGGEYVSVGVELLQTMTYSFYIVLERHIVPLTS